MDFRFALIPLVLVGTATAAAAQYIPGLETPKTTADGFEQMLATACPIAVIGEELAGFTKDHPQETAAVVVPALPAELASYVSAGPKARIMKIPNPGDDLYAIYDADAKLCTVIAMTDPAPIKKQLIDPMASSEHWPKIKAPGAGFNYGFIYDFSGIAKLGVRFSLPNVKDKPVIATVSPTK
jgi:hypothetical protein